MIITSIMLFVSVSKFPEREDDSWFVFNRFRLPASDWLIGLQDILHCHSILCVVVLLYILCSVELSKARLVSQSGDASYTNIFIY